MRNQPTTAYNGITLILDKPSRFDTDHLLTGLAGAWFEEECITPHKLSSVDLRTYEHRDEPYLPGTRFVIWAGDQPNPTGDVPKGYLAYTGNIRHVSVWSPQDCLDVKNYEGASDEDREDDFTDLDSKASYPTKRSNYRFWTTRIIQKLINPPAEHYPQVKTKAQPRLDEVIKLLSSTAGQDIYLDIETSPLKRAIQCVGFSTSASWPTVYVVPIYTYAGRLAYKIEQFVKFHRALSMAFQRNTVVIHNSGFDLLILNAWYKWALPNSVFDTMLAGHRCFPEAEKSLSHNIINWTELPYHKINSVETFNEQQQQIMWRYNSNDVYCLKIIKDSQLAYAATVPGLTDSIAQVNASILPYLDMTLVGLPVDRVAQLNTEQSLLATKRQLERIIHLLVGNATFNPGSTKQISSYLHDRLKYAVVGRTETGAPKLGRKQMFQLLLKHHNPALQAIIAYKRIAKDLSMLSFEYWSTPLAPIPATSTETAQPVRTPGRLVYQRPT